MSLFQLAWKSLWRHRLSTLVTALACALSTGLVMAIFVIHWQAYRAFTFGANGYDAVLGARGSPLQLVLNSVFQLETSPGNLPWSVYREVRSQPGVRRAIPLAGGDNYHGFRIVGTVPEFFTDPPPRGVRYALAHGQWFDPARREAVIGDFVARQTHLKPGDTFHPYHGLVFDETAQHAETYVVVGVMKPTGTPADHVVWIPLEGVYRMTGHVLRGSGVEYRPVTGTAIPEEDEELSAVLLDLDGPQVGFRLDELVNRRGKVATLAYPIGRVVAEIFDKLGWALQILRVVAYLVLLVAISSILTCVYNSVNERRRELAVLRALGMGRTALFRLILLESATVGALGAIGGFLVYAIILGLAAFEVRRQTGVVIEVLDFHPVLVLAPSATVALAAAAGLLPAWRAYGIPVARSLSEVD